MLSKRLIKSNDAGGGACTNTVDLYNPFPDGGGVALYQLNGDATDVSGNYDGTATNVTYGTGVFGQAGVFNGSSSRITTVSSQLPIPASGAFTVSFWAKVDSSLTQYNTCMLSFGDFWLKSEYVTGRFGLGDINVGYETTTSMGYGWNHCVLTVDASNNINLYLNGVNEFTGNKSISRTNGGNFAIGVARLSSPVYYFNGSIDQVRIFSRALRPYEVEALYAEEYCTPTIVPSEHFNTVTYTGNGSTQNITGVGFAPDFSWLKGRSDAEGARIFDTLRGANNALFTNSTLQEVAVSGELTSFDLDGFTLGSNENVNQSSQTYVAWNFKAGGAAVTNTDGTITSQVSANTEAGFSIVSWTGSGSAANIGHGLNDVPSVVIVKNRDRSPTNWAVYHVGSVFGGTTPQETVIYLNVTNSNSDNSSMWNDTAPTSSVFTVNTNEDVNFSGNDMIAYCFAEVAGFSKFGSYVGNGLPLGPTIDCGFEPAFVMIKRVSNTADWIMLDNKRNLTNPKDKYLFANSSAAEGTSTRANFLSNGFEVITTGANMNFNGDNYIYMAFANQF